MAGDMPREYFAPSGGDFSKMLFKDLLVPVLILLTVNSLGNKLLKGLSAIAPHLPQVSQFLFVLILVVLANGALAYFYKGRWRVIFASSAFLSLAFSLLTGSLGLFYIVLYPELLKAMYQLIIDKIY